MLQALKVVRSPQNPFLRSPLPSFSRKTSGVSFTQAKFASTTPESESQDQDKKMSNTQDPTHKTGDVMSHPYGEGYSTRSDEEGFGGTFGGNQSLSKKEDDKTVHENHPDYDKTQGSEVKETEKARNQPHVHN